MEGHALKCPECGVEFIPTDSRQKYCSTRCKARYNGREWALQNPEKRKAQQREWARLNPEKRKAQQREWVRQNPAKHAARLKSYNLTRRSKHNGQFLYILTNPIWPGYSKVGKAVHPAGRLSNYNVGCPDGYYEFAAIIPVHDATVAEAAAHKRLHGYRHRGEWFRINAADALTLIGDLT